MSFMRAALKNDAISRALGNLPNGVMENMAFRNALGAFSDAVRQVPAYRVLLDKNGIRPAQVRSITDFKELPVTDKENYIIPGSLHQLSGEEASDFYTFGTSSGSKGEPLFWPSLRGYDQLLPAIIARYYCAQWEIHKIPTLLLICFPLGAWVGSVKSAAISLEIARDRKYPFTVLAPGASMDDTRKIAYSRASRTRIPDEAEQ